MKICQRIPLKVRLDECPETGALIDYLLVDAHGHVIARLGPEVATEEQKVQLANDLGIRSSWGGHSEGSIVTLEVPGV